MTAYLIMLVAALAAFGGWTLYERNDAVNDYKAKLEAADAKLKKQADALKVEAANHIVDMEAAYESGEENAKVVTRTIYTRGESDVAKYPVFSNPVCVLPDDSLRLLNNARAGVLTAADSAALDAVLPGITTAAERKDGDAIPGVVTGRIEVPILPAPTPTTNSDHKVPGRSVQPHPKPVKQ